MVIEVAEKGVTSNPVPMNVPFVPRIVVLELPLSMTPGVEIEPVIVHGLDVLDCSTEPVIINP